MSIETLIAYVDAANAVVMPSKTETQFEFTALGALTTSAAWGLTAVVAGGHMNPPKTPEEVQAYEAAVERMEDRVAFLGNVDIKHVLRAVANACESIGPQRHDGDTLEMLKALGADGIDQEEVKRFQALDRERLFAEVEGIVRATYNAEVADTEYVKAWAASKLMNALDRTILRMAEFDNASAKFKVAWVRAHGKAVRLAARKEKISIGEATVSHLEAIIEKLYDIRDKAEPLQDAIERELEHFKAADNEYNGTIA